MTPTEFRTTLANLGITLQGFADMTGMDYATVKGWGSKRSGRDVQSFPKWALLILRLLSAYVAPQGCPGVCVERS